MTGYGHGEAANDLWEITAELSGVNRKQTDLAINLPSRLTELEADVRKLIGDRISRGRINARITMERRGGVSTGLQVDEALARQYVEAARRISEATGAEVRIAAADLFRAPGVFRMEETEVEPEAVRDLVIRAVEMALSRLIAMQEEEAGHLRRDLEARLADIAGHFEAVRVHAPEVVETYRRNLHARINASGLALDYSDERLLREIGLFAERCDISEELTRIDSHLAQFQRYMDSGEPVGRPLDFLCQELNREFNTIGSKANDAGIAQRIVSAKTELEKIREQVQNVQ
ncbi:MAG: YicC family protein [Verrucomicrobiae bacterium]|nr:YicC family protein [Verrucomicrobiae bacterium]MCB1088335.1 YicC family protein [Verrucomicrobiae bacterium]MCB1090360.1 YicC family protein [Verrucomicrobiae bacterium]